MKPLPSPLCAVAAMWLLAGFFPAGAAEGGVTDDGILKVAYPASTVEGELQIAVTYTLYVPPGVEKIRGVILHLHGAGITASKEGSTGAYDLHWQALARKWDCALMGSSYHVTTDNNDINPGGSELWFDPRRGSDKAFIKALADFGAKSGHPELAKVPWALWGHSGGGIWADIISTMYPERVACLYLRSGSAAQFRTHEEYQTPIPPEACYSIPILANPGIKEAKTFPKNPPGKEKGPWWGNLATFHEYREHNGLIGFAADPVSDHECQDSRYLAIPYIDACLAARLPDKGAADQKLKPMDLKKAWLAPLMGEAAVPAAEYQGDLKEAVWLPNEDIAKKWAEYVKTGAVADTTPPPAPFDIATKPGEGGTEVTWNAEADFESGIGEFLILRDGQEIGKVPEKPNQKFGRPVFQGKTYHDTPVQPLVQMRFLDKTSDGQKHTYSVITVNSVGLKSAPTAQKP